MSIYSNVTEQDLINLRKLSEQQKNQRAEKIKNKILKQTHDIKLAESLSPITERLDLVENNKGEKIGEIIKKSQQETPAIENTQTQPPVENTPQPAIENTPQPIEDNEGSIYAVELENTLNKMADNTGFFKTYHHPQRGWMIINHPIKTSKGTSVKINENKYNITPGLQKVFTDHSYDTAKSMSDKDKVIFRDILVKTGY